VFADPIAFGPMGRLPVVRFDRSRMESALLCLVCGPRGRHARAFSADDILKAARTIESRLRATHWHRWRHLVLDALDEPAPDDRLERVSQVFEMLRRFGPGRFARSRAGSADPFEVLVTASGRLWRTT
jgi:hypothetical protein